VKSKLLKIGLLCAALGLASCSSGGSDSTSSGTTTGSTPGTTTVAPNTGTVTVTTAPNNVVSIGASGTNAKVADATGKAVFTGLTPGAVDVHVFSADGYSATSYMGINAASITDTNITQSSVIDIYVQVINPYTFTGQTYFLTTAMNTYQAVDWAGTGNISFDLWDIAPGSAVSGTLYATQGQGTSSAGNIVSTGGAEKVTLGTISLTTRAVSGASQQSFVANFAATLPTPQTLVTLQSVTPPAGMIVDDTFFGDVHVYNFGVSGLTLPDTIASVPLGDTSYFIHASSATASWFKWGTFAVGGTVSVAASLTKHRRWWQGKQELH